MEIILIWIRGHPWRKSANLWQYVFDSLKRIDKINSFRFLKTLNCVFAMSLFSCFSESSSSLTSASMTSSMTSSNSQDAGSHSTIDKAVPMSTSNSMHADLETGGGAGHAGLNGRAKSQLLSDHGKDSGDSSAAEEQKSLTSLNREMRMLIRWVQ